MAETADLPDWVTVGAKVAEVSNRYGHGYSVVVLTVDRLTATQVVCTGYPYGNNPTRRFRRDGLRLVGESYGPQLMPLDAREVRDTLARRAVEDVGRDVDRIIRNCGYDEENYRAALGQIADSVAAARERLGWTED